MQVFKFFHLPNTKKKIPKVEDHILAIQAPAHIAVGSVGGKFEMKFDKAQLC